MTHKPALQAPAYYLDLGPSKPFTPDQCTSCGKRPFTGLCDECQTLRDSYAFTKSMNKRRSGK